MSRGRGKPCTQDTRWWQQNLLAQALNKQGTGPHAHAHSSFVEFATSIESQISRQIKHHIRDAALQSVVHKLSLKYARKTEKTHVQTWQKYTGGRSLPAAVASIIADIDLSIDLKVWEVSLSGLSCASSKYPPWAAGAMIAAHDIGTYGT